MKTLPAGLQLPAVTHVPRAEEAGEPARLLRLADGRCLAWQEYGDPRGDPLYVMHGFPGSRLQARLLEEPARRSGVRLVGVDRPGFGASTPAPDRAVLDWPRDVAALADHLGDQDFGMLGISCGGAYALACAHRMGMRLHYVGLIAGMGPMELPHLRAGQLPVLRAMFALARVNRWLAAPMLLADALMFRLAPEKAMATLAVLLAEPDRRMLAQEPHMRSALIESFVEAYRQGIGGPLAEARLIALPRGFDCADIRGAVHLYQGDLDRHVTFAMANYLVGRLESGRMKTYRGEGHLSIVRAAAQDCLRDFKESLQ
ncbi:MAG: alpha/beta hydrolase [Burkholderiales bacterium]|nr:alpha/beta hydrolase [Burkholderiales bacterium]